MLVRWVGSDQRLVIRSVMFLSSLSILSWALPNLNKIQPNLLPLRCSLMSRLHKCGVYHLPKKKSDLRSLQ